MDIEVTNLDGLLGRLARPDEHEKAKVLCETAMAKTGINLDAFVRVKPDEVPRIKQVIAGGHDPALLRGVVVAIGWLAGTDQVMAQVHTTDPGGSGLNNNGCCTIVQLDVLEELPTPRGLSTATAASPASRKACLVGLDQSPTVFVGSPHEQKEKEL